MTAKLWHKGQRHSTLQATLQPLADPTGALFLVLVWDGEAQCYGTASFRFGRPEGPGGVVATQADAVREVRAAYVESAEYEMPLVVVVEKDRRNTLERRRLCWATKHLISGYKSKKLKQIIHIPRVLEIRREAVGQAVVGKLPPRDVRRALVEHASHLLGRPVLPATARALCIGDLISRTGLGEQAVPASYQRVGN